MWNGCVFWTSPFRSGVLPGRVVVLGGGVSGINAARMATGLGADVTILEVDVERMRFLDITLQIWSVARTSGRSWRRCFGNQRRAYGDRSGCGRNYSGSRCGTDAFSGHHPSDLECCPDEWSFLAAVFRESTPRVWRPVWVRT